MTLADLLREMIAAEGPLSLERFMGLVNGHPTLGYYATRDPFGAAGDFTTAPEISQMFGELVGLWAADAWQACGAPLSVHLVELGPGRGTMMADVLRALRVAPDFLAALDVHLVEASPVLTERQRATLASAPRPVAWHTTLDTLPDGPAIVLANEFFDALPVRHFVRSEGTWHERVVGIDGDGAFAWGFVRGESARSAIAMPNGARRSLASLPCKGRVAEGREGSGSKDRPPPQPSPLQEEGAPPPDGTILEVSPATQSVMTTLTGRIIRHGGALLAIDYGHTQTTFGETLQAMCGHRFVDPLDAPGEADLTAHVDFAALARVAQAAGAQVHGPVTQGAFLDALGLRARAVTLSRSATPKQAQAIATARDRLSARASPTDMGALFKVIAITRKDLNSGVTLAGFAHNQAP